MRYQAVSLATMDGQIRSSEDLSVVLTGYTGIVRVYTLGQPPSVWWARRGQLMMEVYEDD